MGKVRDFLNGLSRLTKDGSEVLDSTPVELPVGFERPESIQEMIRRFVTDPAIRAGLDNVGADTFDEADDFEITDDFPHSPHEDSFDPLHLLAREMEHNAGAVSPRSREEVEAARAAIEKVRALRARAAPAAAPASGGAAATAS